MATNLSMLRTNTILLLIATSVLLVVHLLAIEFSLYWIYRWLDMPVHLLGGIVVALLLFSLTDLRVPVPASWYRFGFFMLIVLGFALVWEGYELVIGTLPEPRYWADTLVDIIMGLGGGAIGYYVGNRLRQL
jgi:hypothetical protein